jgi:mitogen-activated protein kinase kinase kinase
MFSDILLGANSVIKFVDFGAAKVIVKGNKTMAKTRRMAAGADGAVMNSLAGTPMYMAPEVIKNEKSGRLGAMDIWSMGCVILEFATGHKPWSNLDNEWLVLSEEHLKISADASTTTGLSCSTSVLQPSIRHYQNQVNSQSSVSTLSNCA